jgi:hypothetical protein
MHVKALERLASSRGVNASKADTITRRLREADQLPLGGRGPNAPQIKAGEVAKFLIAVAGSAKANDAPVRLEKLMVLRGRNKRTLLEALEDILMNTESRRSIREIRIARTRTHAIIVAGDLTSEEFFPSGKRLRPGRFYVAGILDAEFLEIVAAALAGGSDAPAELDADDD